MAIGVAKCPPPPTTTLLTTEPPILGAQWLILPPDPLSADAVKLLHFRVTVKLTAKFNPARSEVELEV